MLTQEEKKTADAGATQESVRMAGVDIDIAKVRARRTMLFPFLTLDLLFLRQFGYSCSTF